MDGRRPRTENETAKDSSHVKSLGLLVRWMEGDGKEGERPLEFLLVA
jgi:hypothetical protein